MKRGVIIGFAGAIAVGAIVVLGVALQSGSPTDAASAPAVVRPSRGRIVAVRPAAASIRASQAALSAPGALPAPYQVLLRRSIFACVASPTAHSKAKSPEGVLALRGIIQQGAGFIALVENTMSHAAQPVRIGDAVGHGKVIDIDLHAVEYAAGGRAMRVEVGETFDGGTSSAGRVIPALAAVRTAPE